MNKIVEKIGNELAEGLTRIIAEKASEASDAGASPQEIYSLVAAVWLSTEDLLNNVYAPFGGLSKLREVVNAGKETAQ